MRPPLFLMQTIQMRGNVIDCVGAALAAARSLGGLQGERAKEERGHLAVPSPPFHPPHPSAWRLRCCGAPTQARAIIFRDFQRKRSMGAAFVFGCPRLGPFT